jgi:hypothetical protein
MVVERARNLKCVSLGQLDLNISTDVLQVLSIIIFVNIINYNVLQIIVFHYAFFLCG